MALPKQKFREILFELLYLKEFSSHEDEALPLVMEQLKVSRKSVLEAQEKLVAIVTQIEAIDKKIESASSEYRIERIPVVELTVLRLALFEILFDRLPPKVAISEAIRLTRKFATPEASKFVNAILDLLYKENSEQLLPENEK